MRKAIALSQIWKEWERKRMTAKEGRRYLDDYSAKWGLIIKRSRTPGSLLTKLQKKEERGRIGSAACQRTQSEKLKVYQISWKGARKEKIGVQNHHYALVLNKTRNEVRDKEKRRSVLGAIQGKEKIISKRLLG